MPLRARAPPPHRRISALGIFLRTSEAALSGQPYVPRNIYVPVDFEDRAELEDALSEQLAGERWPRHSRPHHRPAARRQARTHRPRRQQRQAVLRPALSRAQAQRTRHRGSPAGRARSARAAQANRVLRHFSHSGRGDGRLDGGVGRRQDEEVRLPQVHHPDRRRRRRFCLHARGDHAPLQAALRREEEHCPA